MNAMGRLAVIGVLVVATGAVPNSAANVAAVDVMQSAAPCPDPADPVEPATIADAEQLLIDTWVVCSGEVLPPLSPTEVGIQFDADGRFFRVYEGDDGNLIKVEGLDQQGEWEFVDNEFNAQLDLRLLGSGTFIQLPEFFSSPPLLQTTSTDGEATLVPWTGVPPVLGVPAGIGEGPCGLPRDPVELTSVGQVEQLLAGTWLTCNESSPFGPRAFGEVGIMLTPDGRFARVYEDSEGVLLSANGPGQEGTWVVFDTTTMNGPGSYQVDLNLLDVGTVIGHAVFLQQPTHFRLVTGGVPTIDYQPATTMPVPGRPPTPAPTEPPDDLPETGSNILLALVALGLVAGGFVLVGMSRRRVHGAP